MAMPDIGYGGALGRGGRLIGSRSVRWADEVTTATDWMADHVLAATGRRPGVVPLGVDVSRFAPDPAASEPHRLVHVASLNRVKDQTTLLQAFAKVRDRFDDARLDLIGVDTLGGEMHRLATSLGCADAAEFHGFVPSDELPSFYQRAAVHVISSRHDAGPVSVLEAAACGVPTVGSRVGHIADFARGPNPLAIGVPPGDADLLAEAIIALLTDDDRRSEIGRAARDWAVNHDAAATARAFSDRYRALVAAR